MDNTDIILELKKNSRITATSINNRQKTVISLSKDEQILTRQYIYEIPITNKNIEYDDYHAIKIIGVVGEELRVLNVRKGIVVVEPLVHLVNIKDNMVLGKLI